MPRVVPRNSMTPSISVTVADSRGLRASKSSATRGRPPVISPDWVTSRGIFASSVPVLISAPSSTIRKAPVGIRYSAILRPVFALRIRTAGWMVLSTGSVMTGCFMRVFSSSSTDRVTPSMIPSKATMPSFSLRMKSACGSHSKIDSPALTRWLFLTMTWAP